MPTYSSNQPCKHESNTATAECSGQVVLGAGGCHQQAQRVVTGRLGGHRGRGLGGVVLGCVLDPQPGQTFSGTGAPVTDLVGGLLSVLVQGEAFDIRLRSGVSADEDALGAGASVSKTVVAPVLLVSGSGHRRIRPRSTSWASTGSVVRRSSRWGMSSSTKSGRGRPCSSKSTMACNACSGRTIFSFCLG